MEGTRGKWEEEKWGRGIEGGGIHTGKTDTCLSSASLGLVGVEVALGVGGDVAHLLLLIGRHFCFVYVCVCVLYGSSVCCVILKKEVVREEDVIYCE